VPASPPMIVRVGQCQSGARSGGTGGTGRGTRPGAGGWQPRAGLALAYPHDYRRRCRHTVHQRCQPGAVQRTAYRATIADRSRRCGRC
jgi:hypothetical protein